MSGSYAGLVWRKSSRSSGASGDGNTNDCVEVAFAGAMPLMRDSKAGTEGAILHLTPTGFASFVTSVKPAS
jgi:hypothetical protein